MTRARILKPGFFLNEQLAELPYPARILFEALWCIADRAGRLEDRPKRIKHEALPYDDENVDDLLQLLHDAGFILRYAVDEHRYIQVLNFGKHQSPHVREAPSVIPAAEGASDEHGASTGQAPDKHHASPAVPNSVPVSNSVSDCVMDDEAALLDIESDEATTRADAHTHAPATDETSEPIAETPTPQKRKAAKASAPTSAAPSIAARPVNPLWDALVEVFGYEPRTKPERSKWGGIVKDLKAASATPDEIRQAKTTYDERVALGIINWSLTPNALPNHFAELLQPTRAPTISRPRPAAGGPVRHEPPTMIPASQANQWWVTPHADAPAPTRRTAATSALNGSPSSGASGASGASASVATSDTTTDDCVADALRSPPTQTRRPQLQVIAAS